MAKVGLSQGQLVLGLPRVPDDVQELGAGQEMTPPLHIMSGTESGCSGEQGLTLDLKLGRKRVSKSLASFPFIPGCSSGQGQAGNSHSGVSDSCSPEATPSEKLAHALPLSQTCFGALLPSPLGGPSSLIWSLLPSCFLYV